MKRLACILGVHLWHYIEPTKAEIDVWCMLGWPFRSTYAEPKLEERNRVCESCGKADWRLARVTGQTKIAKAAKQSPSETGQVLRLVGGEHRQD